MCSDQKVLQDAARAQKLLELLKLAADNLTAYARFSDMLPAAIEVEWLLTECWNNG